MTYPIKIDVEAQEEIVEVFDYPEEQREGLGDRFLDEFARIANTLAQFPKSFPLYREDIHKVTLQKFSHLVFYRFTGSEVQVIHIRHQAQRPF